MEVQAFYQDPVIVGGQKIDEEQHCHLAADLITKHEHFFHILFIPDFRYKQVQPRDDETVQYEMID